MINFPKNPAPGQKYSKGIKTWTYNGRAWELQAVSDSYVQRTEAAMTAAAASAATALKTLATESVNPPAAPIDGQEWTDAGSGRRYTWNANSSCWAETYAALSVDNPVLVDQLSNALQLADYAALRAYAGDRKVVYVTGYLATAEPSGMAGMFVLKGQGAPASADNAGTVIVGANGRIWKRIYDGALKTEWFGAKWDGVSDDTSAIQAAVNVGGKIKLPTGRAITSAPITRVTTGLILEGDGIDATVIEPAANFVGSAVFIFGSKNTTAECRQVSVRDLLIDLKARVDAGFEMYGLRDGSSFTSVYIWKIRKYGFRTGWTNSGNNAPYTMNEGLKFDNCHVLSRNDGGAVANGAYFDLSGLYESVLFNCKALGYDATGATHTNMDGFRIGGVAAGNLGDADCQGVRLYNCSVGNFIGAGNRGFFFGNAFHCTADVPTVENMQGSAFVFGQGKNSGTASDQYSAAYCQVTAPRLYNPAGDVAVNATKFEFSGNASQCSVRNVATVGLLAGQKLARFLDTAATCEVHILAGSIDPANMGGYIDFTSLDPSNIVRAYTNSTTSKRQSTFAKDQLYTERSTNGTVIQHTQYYTTYNLAQPLRFCKADGTQIVTVNPDGTLAFNKAVIPTTAVGNAGTVWMDAANGNALKLI